MVPQVADPRADPHRAVSPPAGRQMPNSPDSSARPTLADLAVTMPVWPPHTDIRTVEEALRADPASPGVITVLNDVIYLVDRQRFESALTGRLGFGRALLHHRPLADIVSEPALLLPETMTWDDAARAALARPTGRKAIPLVVAFGGGELGIAPIGPLVDYLSSRYAAMALRDDLTGLGNRRMLTEQATRFGPAGTTAALMLIDLNRFKDINDTLGHVRGDELLRHVAAALQLVCPPDTAYRLGGDEFVILLNTTDGIPPAHSPLAERLERLGGYLLNAISGPFEIAGVPISVEASIGIAHTGLPGMDGIDALMVAADTAMYAAKRDRTQVEVWSPDLASTSAPDLGLQTELRRAITAGELVLHYQPLVDARTHEIISMEALVRWTHPRRGLLAPGLFVPQAEASDIIHLLTDQVLSDAIEQAARWHHAGWTVPVAVNLAAPVLAKDRIVTEIEQLLARTGLPPHTLIVEITESAVMTRPRESAQRLQAIRDLGVRIAMDDFGTGYTSLALLSQLPLDELKLDRSFVMRVHQHHGRAIVEAVARMAGQLGLISVAEGVEDEQTARTLAEIGVDLLQGYHFSRPQPAGYFAHPALSIATGVSTT
ncbi:putative bifunctional diguanylate cyclase/phosphodiesterase [Actinoplanes sp. CA-252034]|uniref:putative bifunctional diguanylate cyclase/phosphodiesterase n=1 Tax=Actinoplanes sp. CA-252034 TaxID=3239906 RepID=UPI003D99882A